MSKEGLPTIDDLDGDGFDVCVVTSSWNEDICNQLEARALETIKNSGARPHSYRVVGALELPVVVQEAAKQYDAVVALGCVIRGGTPHFDYVCDSVTQGLTRIALDEGTPVANGVLTVDTQEQAVDRAGFEGSAEDKGSEAAVAAIATARTLQKMWRNRD